ncbi:unnamed protein product [Boreogadus saida]
MELKTSDSTLNGWGPEACGARVDRRLRLETRGLQHRTRGSRADGADGGSVLKALPGGGAAGGPARPGLCLRRAAGGAEMLEDD